MWLASALHILSLRVRIPVHDSITHKHQISERILEILVEQSHLSCVCRFDRGSKGYLKPSDWGLKDFGRVVERFSVSYMQKFLGLPDITATPEQVRQASTFRISGSSIHRSITATPK